MREPAAEIRKLRKMNDPKKPSAEEVEMHNLTHLPYRNWCSVCVQGRGKEMGHTSGKQERGLPELHFDYMFVGPSDAPGETKTCLVVRDAETRMVMSTMVPAKGRESFAVDRVTAFIEEIGYMHQDLIVKSDQESAVRAVVEEIGRARAATGSGKWIVEHSPVRSSQSNGIVERAVQSVQGQLRVMKLAMEKRWKVTIPSSHPLLAWAAEYAGFLLNRFEVGHDGRTAYERLKGKKSTTLGVEFGEAVHWRIAPVSGALGKLSSSWREGVFLGVKGKSGELVVSDGNGIWKTRTIQRRPMDERWDQSSLDLVKYHPWTIGNAGESKIAPEPAAVKMGHDEMEAERDQVEQEVIPRNYYIKTKELQEHGFTAKCPGCISILRGKARQAHSAECRKRMEEILKNTERYKRADERIATFLTDRLEKDAEERQAKKPRGEQTDGNSAGETQKVRPAEEERNKRPNQDVNMEQAPGSAVEERGGGSELRSADDGEPDQKKRLTVAKALRMWDTVGAVEVDGEGDQDTIEDVLDEEFPHDRGNGELDPIKVREAREEELIELERRMYEEVYEAEAWEVTGKAPIGVRWVDVLKPTGEHRSRLVAQDFRPRSKVGDLEGLYAAMPPIELVKLVIAAAAERCRSGCRERVMLIDIKKAHLHAPIEGNVYVDLPPERRVPGKCAKLKYTLYGMRQAARNWENEYSKTLKDAGFEIGKANGSTFYHRARGVRVVVHGDDFVIAGQEKDLWWTEGVLRKKYPLKMRGILGPGPEDIKEATVLNRCVRWRNDGVVFEADPTHVEKMLETARMADCKANTVPATKEEHPGEDAPLEGEQCRAYRSAVARANYLSQDRPDIRFATKELCRRMAGPTLADWGRLKKLCRYLRGRPRLEQGRVEQGGAPGVIDVYVDSDWAGCQRTRRSTSGGALFAYGVCLKVWSTTQNVVARSSGEAELYAAVRGAAEALGLQSMVADLGLEMALRLHTDSDACRGTCNRTGLGRLKHLQVEHLWIQEAVRKRCVEMVRVKGTENPADLMTKVLGRQRIDDLLSRLGFKEP